MSTNPIHNLRPKIGFRGASGPDLSAEAWKKRVETAYLSFLAGKVRDRLAEIDEQLNVQPNRRHELENEKKMEQDKEKRFKEMKSELNLDVWQCLDELDRGCWATWLRLEKRPKGQDNQLLLTGDSLDLWDDWTEKVPFLHILKSFEESQSDTVKRYLLSGVALPNMISEGELAKRLRALEGEKKALSEKIEKASEEGEKVSPLALKKGIEREIEDLKERKKYAEEFVRQKLMDLNEFGKKIANDDWLLTLVVCQKCDSVDVPSLLGHFELSTSLACNHESDMREYRLDSSIQPSIVRWSKMFQQVRCCFEQIRDCKEYEAVKKIEDTSLEVAKTIEEGLAKEGDVSKSKGIVANALRFVAREDPDEGISGAAEALVAAICDFGLRGTCCDLDVETLGEAKRNEPAVLHHVARTNNDVLKALLVRGIKVDEKDQRGWTPLQYLVSGIGHADAVHALVDQGANIRATIEQDNIKNITPLHLAARSGRGEAVIALLDRGADIHATDGELRTPLHFAAEAGRAEAVVALLDRGADIHATVEQDNIKNITPLHLAAGTGRGEAVVALLDWGADIDATDGEMRTPLHFAAEAGRAEAVVALLGWGADIHAADGELRTPLHFAAEAGRAVVVNALLEKNANVNARDGVGRTALFEAIEAKHDRVVDVMLSRKRDDIHWDELVSTGPYAGLSECERAVSCVDKEDASNIVKLLVAKLNLIRVQSSAEPAINPEVPDGAGLVYLIVKHDLSDELKPLLDGMVDGGTNGTRCIPRLGFDWQRALSPLPNWGRSITLLDIAVASNHQRLVEEIIKYIEANPTSGITSPLDLVDQMREHGGEFGTDVIELLIRHCLACSPPLEPLPRLIQYAITYGCKTLAEELLNGGN